MSVLNFSRKEENKSMPKLLTLPAKQELPVAVPRAEVVITTSSQKTQSPLLALWAVKGVAPIGSPNDLRNPDTSTWRKDTEDRDT